VRQKKHKTVDHEYIASLCARHLSGDYYSVAENFCKQNKLGARDRLRIKRLASQQAAIAAAIKRLQK
jgi:hypothetical protein